MHPKGESTLRAECTYPIMFSTPEGLKNIFIKRNFLQPFPFQFPTASFGALAVKGEEPKQNREWRLAVGKTRGNRIRPAHPGPRKKRRGGGGKGSRKGKSTAAPFPGLASTEKKIGASGTVKHGKAKKPSSRHQASRTPWTGRAFARLKRAERGERRHSSRSRDQTINNHKCIGLVVVWKSSGN